VLHNVVVFGEGGGFWRGN